MTASTEQERQEFEAWTAGAYCLERSSRNTDVYSSTITQCAFDAWQASRRAQAAPVPQGWKLVPEIPTQSMCDAAKYQVHAGLSVFKWADGYSAMLAAAPQPPEAEPVQLPEYGIDTANHAGIRVRGYTKDQVLAILAQHGIKTT